MTSWGAGGIGGGACVVDKVLAQAARSSRAVETTRLRPANRIGLLPVELRVVARRPSAREPTIQLVTSAGMRSVPNAEQEQDDDQAERHPKEPEQDQGHRESPFLRLR